tara:strand:+ start:327 stop:491 length:165 start_codon:yes stop_codon:yes gene_type:complete
MLSTSAMHFRHSRYELKLKMKGKKNVKKSKDVQIIKKGNIWDIISIQELKAQDR